MVRRFTICASDEKVWAEDHPNGTLVYYEDYAALEAQLAARTGGVKPLDWEDADEGMCTKWRAAALGGHYELVAFEKEPGFAVNFHWGRPLSFWFIQGEPDEWGPTGPKMFRTLEAAKAAAQADYERRILSALSPAPEAQEEPHEVLHIYEGDGGVVVREIGNISTFGTLTPAVHAAFEAASDAEAQQEPPQAAMEARDE